MFEKFTRAAREVVINAVEFAADRGYSRIGTERLLAGLAATSSPAAEVLDRLGAGSEQVRIAISDLGRAALATVGIDQDSIRLGPAGNEWLRRKRHIPFNRVAKGVPEGDLREALTMRHRSIGSDHILAALTATAPRTRPAGSWSGWV